MYASIFILFESLERIHRKQNNKGLLQLVCFLLLIVARSGVCLIETLRFAHRRFHVERTDVLPVLGQEGDEEVDRQVDVGGQVFGSHAHVADGHGQADGLLRLELDGRFDFFNFLHQVVAVRDGSWKLAGFVQTGA